MRRKSELSSAMVDRNWPHQIALPENLNVWPAYKVIHDFCKNQSLSLCDRGHSFKVGADWFVVYCFAERAHAEKFKKRFNGEWFDPKKPPR
jgi:hypothetical protein